MSIALPIRLDAHSAWRTQIVALGLVCAAILTTFHRDALHIVSIWWTSSTFNHCLLIPPIIAWLVWQRAAEVRALTPAAWAGGLWLVGLGALGWLLGDAAGVALARHAGLVLMLQGAVVACLGRTVSRGLLFPLAYALFLIPAGEELVPLLQTFTAEVAMALLALAGIPAHIEGIFITTPTGYFEVAEACAGVQFVIAMLAFGMLVANVCFRSWPRRVAFVAVAVAVPILANGVRAFATIYVAHRTGSVDLAAGFDHVVYGGIFFAIIIAIILAIGWRFFDRAIDEPWLVGLADLPQRSHSPLIVAGGSILLAILPQLWSAAVAAAGTEELPAEIVMPAPAGWTRVPAQGGITWRPRFAGADLFQIARYRDSGGREVDLAIAVYSRQEEGRELVGYGQGAAPPDGAWAWAADAAPPLGGRAERIASHGLVREVLSFYRVGNVTTGSGPGVKLETMKTRLLGGPQRAVAILVSAPVPAAGVSARPAIDDFLASLGPVDALADRAAGLE